MKLSLATLFLAASSASAFAPASFGIQRQTALNAELLSSKTGQSSLDPAVIAKYNALPFPAEKVLAEYVWVDAVGNTRSKTRTLDAKKTKSVEELPKWNFDGSSTDQAPGDDSEVILRPCRIFKDPFRPRDDGNDNILVMCDTYTPQGEPLPSNQRAKGKIHTRFARLFYFFVSLLFIFIIFHYLIQNSCSTFITLAMESFGGNEDQEIWFGLEQEFTLFNMDQKTPLGWPEGGMPSRPQGPYY